MGVKAFLLLLAKALPLVPRIGLLVLLGLPPLVRHLASRRALALMLILAVPPSPSQPRLSLALMWLLLLLVR